ncbi:hypothetical protein IWW43_000392 [Coemansia sp. RSA 1935]|nr:hypothetical protein IWW43_000392 [Coemansia sp. RSA 1935]
MFMLFFYFMFALLVHTLAAAPVLFVMFTKIQLGVQMRNCAELQLLVNQKDEPLAELHKQDKKFMRAHAGIKMQTEGYVRTLVAKKGELQELKMKFIALINERNQLLADNSNYLQDNLGLRAE